MSVTRIAIISVTAGMVSLVLAGLQGWSPATDKGLTPAGVVAAPLPTRQVLVRTGSTPQPAESHAAAEIRQRQIASDIKEALATARQDAALQRRIEALRFLGEHALQEDLESLQQIQIQDPVPEVRRAAEEATHLLMGRFSGQPWPGIPSGKHPFDYMGGATSPAIP